MRLQFGEPGTDQLVCEVIDKNPDGHILVRWEQPEFFWERLPKIGQIPLPPYIERGEQGASEQDAVRYQTVYGRTAGSVAAPATGSSRKVRCASWRPGPSVSWTCVTSP